MENLANNQLDQPSKVAPASDLALMLNQINADFYAHVADSFSATRSRPWEGWNRVVELAGACGRAARVLDVACGNLRFERFLDDELPYAPRRFTCVDSCTSLVGQLPDDVDFVERDIVSSLVSGGLCNAVGTDFDLTVCFGFFHHVPALDLRVRLLNDLVARTAPHGLICISLWCFLRDTRLAAKADAATKNACERLGIERSALDSGDRFLCWQEREDVFRFSHSFDDSEIELLANSVRDSAEIIEIFNADGKHGDLNTYLVLRKR